MIVFYIILAILLFGVLILVHEFGHFFTAKLSGVQVNEFSLFMGPALWKKQKGETLYALRCIPVGGYCAMEGEDGDSENPRAFTNAKVWKRLIILAAGSAMNFLTGLLIVALLVTFAWQAIPGKTVQMIAPGRPFDNAQGLQVGDEFVSINGERVYTQMDITMLLDRDPDGLHDITVIRNGETLELTNVPMQRDYIDKDGSRIYGFIPDRQERSLGSILSYTWNQSVDFVRMVRLGLSDLFTGRAGIKDMSGPAGIISTVVEQGVQSESVSIGVENVFYLFAFIAINLAVMNMLPIPALDGGRIACLLVTAAIEKITRRKINPKYEGYLHAGFMVLLLAFMAFITFKDVFQMLGG
ncbi:MAG: site-2 protease family protein [Oscillospiraceae bacterium]|nr:site-2 protease family protein [Oscillospiraceae bacterium]